MEEERFKYIEFLRKNMISKRWYQENPNIQRQSKLLYLTKHDIQQNK